MVKKLKEIVAVVCKYPADKIKKSTSFTRDMGMDSLSIIDVGMAIKRELKIDITEKMDKIKTFGDLINVIKKEGR